MVRKSLPNIRVYQSSDESDVVAVWESTLPSSAPHNEPLTAIRKKLAVDPELFFVAESDGRVVGTAMGGYDGHRGWIYSVAVLAERQRQGIGEKLVRRLERALAERGCLKVNLQIFSSNAAVVAFYEKLGYAVEERISMGKRLYE
jgi:ribosomal protein S18 acetylase RimI-like enzyme